MVVRAQGWGGGVRRAGEVRGPCGDGTVSVLEGLLFAQRHTCDKITESYTCTHTKAPVWRVQFELSSRGCGMSVSWF